MKARMPFVYAADIVTRRSDRIRREYFVESFEFDLPALSSGEVPVAMTVTSQYNRTGRDEYRYREGRFMVGCDAGGNFTFVPQDLVPAVGNRMSHRLVQMMTPGDFKGVVDSRKSWFDNPDYEAVQKPHPSQVREWLDSGREAALAVATRYAEGMAVIDGRLWFPVEEPKLAISEVLAPSLSIISRACDYSERTRSMWGNPSKAPVFNINSMDDVQAHCDERQYAALNVAFTPHTLDIRMPEAFVFDRARHSLEWAACEAIDTAAGEIITASDETVGLWMAARRAYADRETESRDWESGMADAVEALLPRLRSEEHRRSIQAALDSWSESAISLDLGAPMAPRA